jgi:endonuclease/exonuclease/phosphatase family metal-dependent hydrolase
VNQRFIRSRIGFAAVWVFCTFTVIHRTHRADPPSPAQKASFVTFACYNLQNYQISGQHASGEKIRGKSPESMDAVAEIIASARPDILGVCEMGCRESLADLQHRLDARGVRLPEVEFVDGPDPDRHLALLSRFPIAARFSLARVPFVLEGRPQLVRRGFLEVTVEPAAGYRLRLLGAHLKSRLATGENESLVRRLESQLLRERAEAILQANPLENLLVYGDMNDTKDQACIQSIQGIRNSPNGLTDLHARDPLGDYWTHFWKTGDVYARIDYLFASRGLLPEILPERTTIDRSARWQVASDHRMLCAEIIPGERQHPARGNRGAYAP